MKYGIAVRNNLPRVTLVVAVVSAGAACLGSSLGCSSGDENKPRGVSGNDTGMDAGSCSSNPGSLTGADGGVISPQNYIADFNTAIASAYYAGSGTALTDYTQASSCLSVCCDPYPTTEIFLKAGEETITTAGAELAAWWWAEPFELCVVAADAIAAPVTLLANVSAVVQDSIATGNGNCGGCIAGCSDGYTSDKQACAGMNSVCQNWAGSGYPALLKAAAAANPTATQAQLAAQVDGALTGTMLPTALQGIQDEYGSTADYGALSSGVLDPSSFVDLACKFANTSCTTAAQIRYNHCSIDVGGTDCTFAN